MSSTGYGVAGDGDRREASTVVRIWLLFLAAFLLLLVQVGGATRLTGSGLSITTWDVINGVIPPLSDSEWRDALDLYQETYQGRFQNASMSLEEFKTIYLWEWFHRLAGRIFFLLILVPFLAFRLLRLIARELVPKVLILLGLVLLQGLAGWLMVRSGLRDDVKVNPTWLAIHLTLAAIIFGALLAMAFGQDKRPRPVAPASAHARFSARILVGLAFLMIVLGALVAGNKSGWLFTVPQVLGAPPVSPAYFTRAPWYINFVENDWMVMANHRTVAVILIGWAFLHARSVKRLEADDALKWGARSVLIGVLAQSFYGVFVLFQAVQPWQLGLLHQLFAFVLLALTIWHLYEVERHPREDESAVQWLAATAADEPRASALSQPSTVGQPSIPEVRRDALLRAEALSRPSGNSNKK